MIDPISIGTILPIVIGGATSLLSKGGSRPPKPPEIKIPEPMSPAKAPAPKPDISGGGIQKSFLKGVAGPGPKKSGSLLGGWAPSTGGLKGKSLIGT